MPISRCPCSPANDPNREPATKNEVRKAVIAVPSRLPLQRRQSLHELRRAHHQVRRAVASWCLQLEFRLPGGVELNPLVRQRQPRDVSAQLLQSPTIVCFDPHGRVQTEVVDVGILKLARHALAPTGVTSGANRGSTRAQSPGMPGNWPVSRPDRSQDYSGANQLSSTLSCQRCWSLGCTLRHHWPSRSFSPRLATSAPAIRTGSQFARTSAWSCRHSAV